MEKLTFALTTMAVCLWANRVDVSVIVLSIMGWASIRKGGTPWPIFIRLMLVPLSFLIFAVLSISIEFVGNPKGLILTIPFFQKYLGISKAGLAIGVSLVCKGLSTVSCLYFLVLTTPAIDLLAALKKLKLPKLLLELMSLIYRFIFLLMEMAVTIFIAQKSRLGYSSLVSGYRSLGMLGATIFIRALRRGNEIYIALEARGYHGQLNVLREPYEKDRFWYVFTIIINIFLVTIALSGG